MPPANRDRFLAHVFERETSNMMPNVNTFGSVISIEERAHVLRKNVEALEQLQIGLLGNELELHWIDQILQYMRRLQSVAPAYTPEEQFQHVYTLRKWIYWLPVTLLRRPGSKGPAILVLAHLYAAAVSFQPLFPDLAATFPMSFALPPLEAIISMTDMMQNQQGSSTAANEIATMMRFARHTANEYRERQTRAATPFTMQFNDSLLIGTNISPAFTPAVPPFQQTPSTLASSTYLGVPTPNSGFTYIADNWGVVPSPGFPPLRQDSFGSFDSSEEMYPISHPGFVTTVPIWT